MVVVDAVVVLVVVVVSFTSTSVVVDFGRFEVRSKRMYFGCGCGVAFDENGNLKKGNGFEETHTFFDQRLLNWEF